MDQKMEVLKLSAPVIPARVSAGITPAGIQVLYLYCLCYTLDSRLRGNDTMGLKFEQESFGFRAKQVDSSSNMC
jgi:hypothetical protein